MKKVLIVDDEPLVRRSLARIFQKDYQVFECEEGASGLLVWQKEQPDVVFLDVLMPGKTGPEMLKEVNPQTKAKSKVILISAFTGDFNAIEIKTMGADLFLAKPFEDIFAVKKITEDLLNKFK